MRKKIFYICLLSSMISICRGAWFENDTRYRLEVLPETTGQTFFVDIGNKILPENLTNGVSVYTEQGKTAPFYFSRDRKRLFIHSDQNINLFHIYFGFNTKQASSKWHKDFRRLVNENDLELTVNRIWNRGNEIYTNDNKTLFSLANYCFSSNKDIKSIINIKNKMRNLSREIRVLKKKENGRGEDKVTEQQKKLEIEISKLKKTFINTRKKVSETNEIDKAYFNIVTTKIIKKPVNEILLRNFKPDRISPRQTMAVMFRGQLHITKEGEYEFGINSRDASLLTINGNEIVTWPGEHYPTDNFVKTGTIQLKPGFYDLCFYNFRIGKTNYAEAAWKKPGEKNFKRLTKKDFIAAFPSKITSCVNKENQSFPIINYSVNGYFLLDKGRKADWIKCWVEGDTSDIKWLSDETFLSDSNNCSFLRIRGENNNLSLASKSGKFHDIPISFPEAKLGIKRFDPDIKLKLWTPSFIYDEEILDMDFEMVSGLPQKTDILLKTTLSRPVSFLKNSSRFIPLEGKLAYDKYNRFSPPYREKESIEIIGEELKNGLYISFYLMLPPVIFSQQNVRFAPIAECAGIMETVEGMKDNKGNRVIPIIHRPNLAEKRVWSLSKSIMNELSKPKKILVVADDFGLDKKTLRQELENKLKAKSIKLEFASWNNLRIGSSLRGSIGKLIPLIQKSTADRIIFIPPAEDINTGIPVRTQTRSLAALVQIAQNNKNIKIIYISSPFPSLKKTKLDDELTTSLKKMAAEYNIEFLDLNSFLRNKPNWRYSYRFDKKNNLLYEQYPVHYTKEIAQKIFDSM